ncbi:MAG: hypothetical protein R3302_04820 [Sulfurimonadaceae bacterium]|nr:hypothetical protein [Sulfurimonadaceae bacterium]
MVTINWDQYKEYKSMRENPHGYDNFMMLLEFMRSFYNMHSVYDIYDTLYNDELARMMLEKRDISEPEQLEDYLFKILRS